MSKELRRRVRFIMLVMGVIVAGLVLTSVFIRKGDDVLWLNGHHNSALDFIFYYVTSLGNGAMLLVLIFPALFQSFRFTLTLITSFALVGTLSAILKSICQMPRPAKFLGSEFIHVVYDVNLHSQNSFPSGHTATAFCIAAILALQSKNRLTSLMLILIALLVGLSRIYLGQHFVLDVSAGALLGCVCGISVSLVFQQFTANWLERRLVIPSISMNRMLNGSDAR